MGSGQKEEVRRRGKQGGGKEADEGEADGEGEETMDGSEVRAGIFLALFLMTSGHVPYVGLS